MGKIPTKRAAGPAAAPGLEPALRHLLAPLVRLLIRQGVPYTAFATMLKEVYFDVATRELPEGDRETTSRISLVTGLHRKDVRRMREGADERPVVTRETSVASEVFTRWIADPRFLDRRHRPRVLPRLPQGRRAPSFESLATAVSKDVRPRAILDELLRLGLAAVDANDRVSLNLDAFAPQRGTEELLYFFGENPSASAPRSTTRLSATSPTCRPTSSTSFAAPSPARSFCPPRKLSWSSAISPTVMCKPCSAPCIGWAWTRCWLPSPHARATWSWP